MDAELWALGAPLVDFDVPRTRALALCDLRSVLAAAEQARIALAIAHRQGWPQQVRRMVADLGLAPTAVEPELDQSLLPP